MKKLLLKNRLLGIFIAISVVGFLAGSGLLIYNSESIKKTITTYRPKLFHGNIADKSIRIENGLFSPTEATVASSIEADLVPTETISGETTPPSPSIVINPFPTTAVFENSASKKTASHLAASNKKGFRASENPVFDVQAETAADIETVVLDARGNISDFNINKSQNNGGVTVTVEKPMSFRPGKYTLKMTDITGNTETQDFSWGVLAINPDKPVYHLNETANLAMAVLNERGDMVCDAQVTLKITNSAGGINDTLSTDNGRITVNPECTRHNFALNPDYSAKFKAAKAGNYQIELSAVTTNGTFTINDNFVVDDNAPFYIQRIEATRIYPVNAYPVKINLEAESDFNGIIREKVPSDFQISQLDDNSYKAYDNLIQLTDHKNIEWKVNLKKGDKVSLGYKYNAPVLSPEFYLTGGLEFVKNDGNQAYQESRQWQIASDAVGVLVPAVDIGNTSWTSGTCTTNLYACIDEGTSSPNDADYIMTSAKVTGVDYTLLASTSPADVVTVSRIDITTRALRSGNNGTSLTIYYGVGGSFPNTQVGSTITLTASAVNYSVGVSGLSLPKSQVDNLRVRYRATSGTSTAAEITAAQFNLTYTAQTMSVSGSCKKYDESTSCANGETVRIAYNNILQSSTATLSGGTYVFTGQTMPNGGTVITAFVSGVGASLRANTVTEYSGVGNLTGLNLFENHLTIGHSGGTASIGNTDAAFYDSTAAGVGSSDVFFDVSVGATSTLNTDIRNQFGTQKLYITPGNEFRPAASGTNNVVTKNITIGGTLTADANVISTNGSWTNSGSFNSGTGSIVFNSVTGGNILSGTMTGNNDFNKLAFAGIGGSWTVTDPLRVGSTALGSMQVLAGVVTMGDSANDNLEVDGELAIGSTAFAVLQTNPNLAIGSSMAVDINNNASPVTCPNCVINIGTATNTNPNGELRINKNTILRLNSFSSVQSGVNILASGKFNVNGSQDDTGTNGSTTTVAARESKVCANKSWAANSQNGKTLRMTSGLAFGRLYPITGTITSDTDCTSSYSSVQMVGTTSATTTVSSISCNGSNECTIVTAAAIVTADNDGIGRYLHDLTTDKYYLIQDSVLSTKLISVANNDPDATSNILNGDSIQISDGVRSNDTFEIINYAWITAKPGLSCNDTNYGFIYMNANSELSMNYTELCNLGTQTANRYGAITNGGAVNNNLTNEGTRVTHSYFHNLNARGISNGGSAQLLTGVVFSDNFIGPSVWHGIASNMTSARVINNRFKSNGTSSIELDNSNNTEISGNIIESGASAGIELWQNSPNMLVYGNSVFKAVNYGVYLNGPGSGGQIVSNNKIFGNGSYGIYDSSAGKAYIVNNRIFANNVYGVFIKSTPTMILVDNNIDVGGSVTNSDVYFADTTTSKVAGYNNTLGSSVEVGTTGTLTTAYFVSNKHDGTNGSTKIWGNYTLSADNAETPQDESKFQANHTDVSYTDGFTPHIYYGGGTEDTNLGLGFSGNVWIGANTSYGYRVVCTNSSGCAAGGSNDWTVYRDETSIGNASSNTLFVDPTTKVQFTVHVGAVNYSYNDAYQFVAYKNSQDTNTQKTTSFMQDGNSLSVPQNTTLVLHGLNNSSSPSIMTRGGTSGGFHIAVNGNIDAQNYKMSYLGGSGGGIGLDLTSLSTVTNLSNGTFDNYQNVGTSDTFIRVDTSKIGNSTPSQMWNGMSFTQNSTNPKYTFTVTGSVVTGYWQITATCSGWSSCSASDNDTAQDNIRWTLPVYFHIYGSCKMYDRTSNCIDGESVKYSVKNTLAADVGNIVGGTFAINSSAIANSGDVMTFYTTGTGVSAPQRANTITRYPGSGDISGINLYENHLTIGSSSGNVSIGNTDLAWYDNTAAGTGSSDVFFDVSVGATSTLNTDVRSQFANQKLYIVPGNEYRPAGNVTAKSIDIGGTLTTDANPLSVFGGWNNSGNFNSNITGGTEVVNFTGTGVNTLSGSMTGSNAFNKLTFAGIGGSWTITDPIQIGATNLSDTMQVLSGVVTMGDGPNDNFEVDGKLAIGSTNFAVFQTNPNLAWGSSQAIDINNNASPASCPNCTADVGTATNTNPNGELRIFKNALFRLNSGTSVETGINTLASGKLVIQGSQDDSDITGIDSVTEGTGSTITLADAGHSWTTNAHQGKSVRISNTSSLAFGKLYTVASNDANSLTIGETWPNVDTGASMSAVGATTTIYSLGGNLFGAGAGETNAVGEYVFNMTDNRYYQIVRARNNGIGNTDVISVVGIPDTLPSTLSGKSIKISDGIRSGDSFEIYDYANVTASSGLACTNDESGAGKYRGFINGQTASENVIQYANVCNMGKAGATTTSGLSFFTINGNNSNEGVKVSNSKLSRNYYGVNFFGPLNNNNTNNKGVTNNVVFGNDSSGIMFSNGNINDYITNNSTFSNGNSGINVAYSSKNTLIGNKIYQNGNGNYYGIYFSYANNNVISANNVFGNSTGISLSSSNNNVISGNTVFGNSSDGIILNNANNNILNSNSAYSNSSNGIYLYNIGSNNIISSNIIYSNVAGIINYYTNTTLFSNSSYGNSQGFINGSSLNRSVNIINDNYGSLYQNKSADVWSAMITSPKVIKLFNTSLNSNTKVYAVNVAKSEGLISKSYNGTNGLSKIWGAYSIGSTDDPNTPQDESKEKYNYNNNSWEGSSSSIGYSGIGNGVLKVTTVGSITGPEWYRAELGTTAVNGGTFNITRGNGPASPASVTLSGGTGSYVEATTGVGFTITDGTTDFAQNNTFTFAVWPASNDTGTSKTVTFMGTGETVNSSIGVTNGASIEMIGVAGSQTVFQKDVGASGFEFTVQGGSLKANQYQMLGLGNSGMYIQSGTVADLSNGTFDNSGGKIANNSSYITVNSSVLDAGGTMITFGGVVFDAGATDPNIKYNVTLIGTPLSANNIWSFIPSSGNMGGAGGENFDLDPGDGIVNNNSGYIIWTLPASGPTMDQILRHGTYFQNGVKQPFSF